MALILSFYLKNLISFITHSSNFLVFLIKIAFQTTIIDTNLAKNV